MDADESDADDGVIDTTTSDFNITSITELLEVGFQIQMYKIVREAAFFFSGPATKAPLHSRASWPPFLGYFFSSSKKSSFFLVAWPLTPSPSISTS